MFYFKEIMKINEYFHQEKPYNNIAVCNLQANQIIVKTLDKVQMRKKACIIRRQINIEPSFAAL
jgi:Tfp pilus assembly protein PilF